LASETTKKTPPRKTEMEARNERVCSYVEVQQAASTLDRFEQLCRELVELWKEWLNGLMIVGAVL